MFDTNATPVTHSAIVTCGNCGHSHDIPLGFAHAIGCQGCDSMITLGEDPPPGCAEVTLAIATWRQIFGALSDLRATLDVHNIPADTDRWHRLLELEHAIREHLGDIQ